MTYVPPPTIAPTVTKDTGSMPGHIKTHPAYGMLRFSRVSGDPGTLFGSEVKHTTSFIQLTLVKGDEKWSGSQVWHHGNGRGLVEVNMTHGQFAELITSMNIGSGVPCTIRHLPGEEMPHIADESTIHEQIKEDVKGSTDKAVAAIGALAKAIAEAKMPKGAQAQLLDLTRRAHMSLSDSLPFVLDQYQEALDTMKARAATEVDAMLTGAIQRAGLNALKLDSGVSAPTLHS